MMSKYKVGTISAILAKESGGGDQKPDPKLAALFGGGGGTPTLKVFRTVKVEESQIFKKAKSASVAVSSPGVTAKKVAKKKRDDITLKNKDAAGIRVSAKKKVKTEIEDAAADMDGGSPPDKKKNAKKKKNKVKKVKVQDETISSTSVVENPSSSSLTKKDKKKKKKKLDAEETLDDKKKGKKRKQDVDPEGNEETPPKKTKTKAKKKLKKKKEGKILKGKGAVKSETAEDNEDDIGNKESEEEEEEGVAKTSGDAPGVFKTLAERNAPKPKDVELEGRTLFVGNLPGDVQKKDLKKLFKKFGKIETVRLRGAAPNKPTQLKKVAINKKELHSDKSTITGYIRFATREDAENAVTKGRGLIIKDNHLVLDLADQAPKKDNKKAIFIGNLNLRITDEELWRFFEDCGTILSVRVIRDNGTGMGKGFGYVNFEEREAVDKALEKNQQELRNRTLRISRCVKKLKVKKVLGAKKPGVGVGKKAKGGKGNPKREKGKKFDDSQEYTGDKLAEIGKLKRKSNKPNRGEMRKARIAKFLTGKAPPGTTSTTNSKNRKNATTNPNTKNKQYFKRYFN